MSWLSKLGKSVEKAIRPAVKAVANVVPYGNVVLGAARVTKALVKPSPSPAAFVAAIDPVTAVYTNDRPPIPYETVRGLVVSAYERGKRDALSG